MKRKEIELEMYKRHHVMDCDIKHDPKNDPYLNCLHPFHGQNGYVNLQGEIMEADLESKKDRRDFHSRYYFMSIKMATMPELISIVHDAYGQQAGPGGRLPPRYDVIKSVMGDGFYAATKTLWIPDKGAKVFDDGAIQLPDYLRHRTGKISAVTLESLLHILEQHPKSVIDVPFGFKEGGMFPVDLELNTYLRALAGTEGASKLHEIAENHLWGINPQLIAYRNVEQPIITVSRLRSSSIMGHNYGLIIDCRVDGTDNKGYAFGVLK